MEKKIKMQLFWKLDFYLFLKLTKSSGVFALFSEKGGESKAIDPSMEGGGGGDIMMKRRNKR